MLSRHHPSPRLPGNRGARAPGCPGSLPVKDGRWRAYPHRVKIPDSNALPRLCFRERVGWAVAKGKEFMINELDVVALTTDVPADGLNRGDIGTVVHVHGKGEAFEVEFVALDGETIALLTLPVDAIRAIRPREIPHLRQVA
jgi:hypothetical protein